jgi:dUTP pyrophosphatase
MIDVRLEQGGIAPQVSREGDAAFDCYSTVGVKLFAGERRLIPLGFGIALPQGKAALIVGRSGNTMKNLDVELGVIDNNYRGQVSAMVTNTGTLPASISPGQRVAQMLIIDTYTPTLTIVAELPESNRGAQGFGSSGE